MAKQKKAPKMTPEEQMAEERRLADERSAFVQRFMFTEAVRAKGLHETYAPAMIAGTMTLEQFGVVTAGTEKMYLAGVLKDLAEENPEMIGYAAHEDCIELYRIRK